MQATPHVSLDAYLTLDAESDGRYEYWDGRVVAMAGAEPEHNQLAVNLATELNLRLRDRGCRLAVADQRVRVEAGYVYPDVVLTCADPDYENTQPRTLRNPELLVEILSPTSIDRDMEDKLVAYTGLASLQEYWIVSTSRVLVMQYLRRASEWVLHAVVGLNSSIESDHFDLAIPLRDIYRLVIEEE